MPRTFELRVSMMAFMARLSVINPIWLPVNDSWFMFSFCSRD